MTDPTPARFIPRLAPKPPVQRPTVALIGAGAIGLVIADALTATAEVTLCRRNSTNRMTLSSGEISHEVDAAVWDSPSAAENVDWIVLATKAQDTASTRLWFAALTGANTRVLVAQNGIAHAQRVAAWIPASRVVPATVNLAAERVAADEVAVKLITSLVVPRTAVAREFAELIGDSLPVVEDEDFIASSWRKLIINAALNPITALTSRSAAVTHDHAAQHLFVSAVREGIAVAQALGVTIGPQHFAGIMATLRTLPADFQPSMLQDVLARRPLEHEHLTGTLVRAGASVGVATPTLATLDSLLSTINASHVDALTSR